LSDDEDPNATQSGSAMADHLQRYKNYINNLKKGKSSGISAAFGRATDLLPPELFEIKPPHVRTDSTFHYELNDQIFIHESDRARIKETVVKILELTHDQLNEPVGTAVRMPDGRTTVVDVLVESGQRLFMLANGKVIDERAFSSLSVERASAAPAQNHSPAQLTDTERELISELEGVFTNDEDDDDNNLSNESHTSGAHRLPDQNEQTDADQLFDQNEQTDADQLFDENEQSNTHQSSGEDDDERFDARAGETNLEFDESNWDEGWPELTITTAGGANLWNIYYDGPDVRAVVMSDGSSIRRAEGRPEFVLALRSDTSTTYRFFVLDGLIVDPSTGNVYIEANDGAYSAAFLNNGWILHQYRTHDGSETYYSTAPASENDERRITLQVLNLTLDASIGVVTYDTLDGSASVTLKSRSL
jgi:hypothetical protein